MFFNEENVVNCADVDGWMGTFNMKTINIFRSLKASEEEYRPLWFTRRYPPDGPLSEYI